jgi:ketosteroid isomerase-like protein
MSQLADLIQRYYDVFNRRDFAAYDRLFTPDCLIEAPGVELRGVEGARAFDRVWQTAMPDAKIVNLRKATGEGLVICENRLQGTHEGPLVTAEGTLAPTGKPFDEPYTAVFELERERIKRQTLHFDRLRVVQMLGGEPPAAKNLAVAQGLYAAYGRRDMKWILDAVADDVVWGIDSVAAREVPAYGVGRGKQHVEKFFAAWGASADFESFEAGDFVAAGDHVFATLRYELVVKATGKRLKSESPQHFTIKDGKIVAWRGYEDTAATRDAFTAAARR